jgi:hypothetical protein
MAIYIVTHNNFSTNVNIIDFRSKPIVRRHIWKIMEWTICALKMWTSCDFRSKPIVWMSQQNFENILLLHLTLVSLFPNLLCKHLEIRSKWKESWLCLIILSSKVKIQILERICKQNLIRFSPRYFCVFCPIFH